MCINFSSIPIIKAAPKGPPSASISCSCASHLPSLSCSWGKEKLDSRVDGPTGSCPFPQALLAAQLLPPLPRFQSQWALPAAAGTEEHSSQHSTACLWAAQWSFCWCQQSLDETPGEVSIFLEASSVMADSAGFTYMNNTLPPFFLSLPVAACLQMIKLLQWRASEVSFDPLTHTNICLQFFLRWIIYCYKDSKEELSFNVLLIPYLNKSSLALPPTSPQALSFSLFNIVRKHRLKVPSLLFSHTP